MQSGFSSIGYDKIYDEDGKKHSILYNVRDNVLQLYADYGLRDRISVRAMPPFKLLSKKRNPNFIGHANVKPSFQPDKNKSGIGDVDMRYNFKDRGFVELLGARTPAPGGGSTSALIASMGAAHAQWLDG